MEHETKKLTERIEKIEERNNSVEADKAWETSWTRRLLLLIITYVVIALYLKAIEVARPWVNAIVPALGFVISTLVLPLFKKWWLLKVRRDDTTRQ